MTRFGLLKRIFAAGRPSVPAYVTPGSLTGIFSFNAQSLFGEVTDEAERKLNEITIHLLRAGKEIAQVTAARNGDTHGYSFEMPAADLFPARELISDKVQVLARGKYGDSGKLRLDGAVELALAREYLGAPVEVVCDIHFTEAGNSRDFIGAGWSGPEPRSTWTEDDDSLVNLPALATLGAHAFRLTTGAMVSEPLCTGQSVELYLNEQRLWGNFITFSHPQFFEIRSKAPRFSTSN